MLANHAPHKSNRVGIQGAGLGFRRDLVEYFRNPNTTIPAFIECAPENWMEIGGHWKRVFDEAVSRFPLTCHGLSLSLGSPEELDWDFLARLKKFFKQYPVQIYSEHLSYAKCSNAHLYDLLPIPFREDAVEHVARRIRQVQDFLERRIAIENVSYYTAVAPEMGESDFIRRIVERADCDLLLDINNVYVNSFNHKYDARVFLEALPLERVVYIHMAGHEQRSEDLIIDTHGAPVADPVFDLFSWCAPKIQPVPVLLERDFEFPDPRELENELHRLNSIVEPFWEPARAA